MVDAAVLAVPWLLWLQDNEGIIWHPASASRTRGVHKGDPSIAARPLQGWMVSMNTAQQWPVRHQEFNSHRDCGAGLRKSLAATVCLAIFIHHILAFFYRSLNLQQRIATKDPAPEGTSRILLMMVVLMMMMMMMMVMNQPRRKRPSLSLIRMQRWRKQTRGAETTEQCNLAASSIFSHICIYSLYIYICTYVYKTI